MPRSLCQQTVQSAMYTDRDDPVVMMLDGGGTNFVFSAIWSNREIIAPFVLPQCSGWPSPVKIRSIDEARRPLFF
jgi:hypothetical protein